MFVERVLLRSYAEADGVLGFNGASQRMIPTLLFVGLLVGVFVRDRRSLVGGSLVVVVAALLWGLGVGMTNESINTFFGGAALALANLVVGGAFSASLTNICRFLTSRSHTAMR